MFAKHLLNSLPSELVDIIADYHDYEKYCKPQHQEKLNNINRDIISMSHVMKPIHPNLARQCWGPQAHLLPVIDWNNQEEEEIHDNDYDIYWEEIMDNLADNNIDDEENNFGLDYDDTHYYDDDNSEADRHIISEWISDLELL